MNRIIGLLAMLCLCAVFSVSTYAQIGVKVTITEGVDDKIIKEKIETTASAVLSAFNAIIIEGKRAKAKLREYQISKEMEKPLLDMWNSSAMLCPISEINQRVVSMSDGGFQLRNIPIEMLAADPDEQEQELVFEFTPQGDLNNVVVALEKQNYNQVICSNITVEDFTRRQIILDFVENFRTAYNRKDWNYLNLVYSDDALIITGKVVTKKENSDSNGIMNALGAKKVLMQVQDKASYMEKLKRVFSKNNYINLKFEDLTVRRHPKYEAIYGVTLKQYWNTSTYSDVGYLFLMINFTDENNPSIEVRTWQPEKYEDHVISRDEVFSFEDFNI